MLSLVLLGATVSLPFIAYYILAGYVAHKNPNALKHLEAMHPRALWKRVERNDR